MIITPDPNGWTFVNASVSVARLSFSSEGHALYFYHSCTLILRNEIKRMLETAGVAFKETVIA